MTRQSRYKTFDSLGFMTAIHTTLFTPTWKHLEHLLRQVQLEQAKATGDGNGFQFDDRFFPTHPNANYDKLRMLVPELHERMQDYLDLQRITEQESHRVLSWYQNMLARCFTIGQVKHNLLPEVVSVIWSDQAFPPLATSEADDSVLYPQDPEVIQLQRKYIGFRFVCS